MNFDIKNNNKLSAFSLIEISIVILIIGILIAGITQSSRLVTQARVNTAKSMTQASPASSISGMHFWAEAANLTNFQSNIDDDDEVTTWKDINPQVGSKSNVTGTPGATPTYILMVLMGSLLLALMQLMNIYPLLIFQILRLVKLHFL